MFTDRMFVETFELKRAGLRGKKLAKSMAEKFSSYSADELKVFSELVPSPELRHQARAVHTILLTLLGVGCVVGAYSFYLRFSAGDRDLRTIALPVVWLFCRVAPLYLVARYRRDGALGPVMGAAAMPSLISAMHPVDVVLTVILPIVSWFWLGKLFPNLDWRGKLRS